MAGQDAARVLHAGAALERALEQVARLREDGEEGRGEEAAALGECDTGRGRGTAAGARLETTGDARCSGRARSGSSETDEGEESYGDFQMYYCLLLKMSGVFRIAPLVWTFLASCYPVVST